MALLSTLALASLLGATPVPASATVRDMTADPSAIRLEGPTARYSILTQGVDATGKVIDLTRTARYRVLDPAVASVDAAGVVRPLADGRTAVVVAAGGVERSVEVVAAGTTRPRSFHFENDIIPVLTKLGCNASGCHGKAEGQNGFKLSVFGSDPEADYAALTREGRGRRLFPARPERSLLLTKMAGDIPHGGGVRAGHETEDYRTLRDWIAAGTPMGSPDAPRVVAVRVEPRERVLDMKGSQQLRVIARRSDGVESDVTAYARFQSNNEDLAAVNDRGLVRAGESPGDVAVMASYMGAVDVFRALVPRPGGESDTVAAADLPTDPIDAAVARKLRLLNIEPSGPCTDADYLRRVYLDVIGTLPTAAEARRFLNDTRPDRRARLVDSLLGRPEYADYWALKWSDLLRIDRAKLGHKRAFAFYRWVRDRLADGTPLDEFARAVVTAEGPLDENGPANFYKVATKPGEAAGAVAQVFLGIRIACAECHHHPYDRWAQDDYYGMTAYFAPLSVSASAGVEALTSTGEATATNPRTRKAVKPHALGTPASAVPAASVADPRGALADWLASPGNPYFARHLANRYWAHFLGRGLVEPVDDVRDTNPPSNPELLDALAKTLVDNRFDPRALIRAIVASETYQRSAAPNATNLADEQNYSRARLRRLDAEVLLDMVCQTTGIPEKFPGVPGGVRAIQLWDSKVSHYFLRIFGRPARVTSCVCERGSEPGASQVLHLLNSPEIHAKLSHEAGSLARLSRRVGDDAALIDEIYLTFFARFPTADERDATALLAADPAKRREASEDLAWVLMNSLEFFFNH